MPQWTAEITNDPHHDYGVYIELLEDDEYKGRLYRDETGRLMLRLYKGDETIIPFKWLLEIAERAEVELR